MAVSIKIWFSQMIGVASPLPGILTFHFTFCVSDQIVGGFAAGAAPVARGPRHCGQFCSADAAAAENAETASDKAASMQVKRTTSPLTPALSPSRGEGERL